MLQILVIEDDKDIQEVLKNYLTAEGYGVALAGDGVEGIAAFHAENPDLVLLDIMMPKIDGITLIKQLKSNKYTNPSAGTRPSYSPYPPWALSAAGW